MGHEPIALVVHTMVGTLVGTDSWFNSPNNKNSSAHVGVGLDGTIHEYVAPENSAWANGRLEAGNRWPGPVGINPINPNYLTLSVETEDRGRPDTEPVTDAQFASVVAWGKAMIELYPTVVYLVSHAAISPKSRSCPAARWLSTGRFAELAEVLGLEAIT